MANVLREELRRQRRFSDEELLDRGIDPDEYYGRPRADYWDRPRGRYDYPQERREIRKTPWTVPQEDWRTYGPYTGMGPQGYHRSDERIMDDIYDRLTQHGHINAREIEVVIQGGEVTLRGTVDDRRSKRLAEDLVETVLGVTDVHNQIRVRQPTREEAMPPSERR